MAGTSVRSSERSNRSSIPNFTCRDKNVEQRRMSGSEPVFVRPSGRRKASVYRTECKVERKGTAVWKKVEGDGGGKRDSEPKARQPGFTLSRLKNARNVEESHAGGVPPRCDVDQLNRDAENLCWALPLARSYPPCSDNFVTSKRIHVLGSCCRTFQFRRTVRRLSHFSENQRRASRARA